MRAYGNVTVDPTFQLASSSVTPAGAMEAAGRLAGLVDDNARDLTASWYDTTRQRLVVSYATERGRRLLEESRRSGLSFAIVRATGSLRVLQSRLDGAIATSGLHGQAQMWGLAPDGAEMIVALSQAPSRTQISAMFGRTSLPVRLVRGSARWAHRTDSREVDDSPYAGGARWGAGAPGDDLDHRCTTGFGQLTSSKEYVLTAGHCNERNTTFTEAWIYKGPNDTPTSKFEHMANFGNRTTFAHRTGTITTGTLDSDFHGDLSILAVSDRGHTTGTNIWVSSLTKRSVISRHAPVVDQLVCRSGVTSGEVCGFRTALTNWAVTYQEDDGTTPTVHNVDLARRNGWGQTCALSGDSGGSVYNYSGSTSVQAVGVISGIAGINTNDCYLVFTGTEEALQAWGGTLDMA